MNSRTNHQEEEIPPHEHSQVDVRTISAPILTMISLVGFVVWARWVVTTERYKIRDEFEAQIRQNTEDIRKLDAYDHDTLAKETEKEDYHQQYLAKNPDGDCGLGGTGVACPAGLALG